MKQRYFSIVLIFLSFCCTTKAQSDFEQLREKVASQYLSGEVNENQVTQVLNAIKSDGTWPGIDYVDTTRVA